MGTSEVRQVVCMKWGTRYGVEYVNRLYATVRHHVAGRLRFVCLTDDPRGLRPEVEHHDCPEVDLPPPYDRTGWRKISLFAPPERLFGMAGDWLFLDLDVVVTGPLDDLFTFAPEARIVVMRNWTQPGRGIGNTSVYRFRPGADAYLLETLHAEWDRVLREHRNEQTYVSRTARSLAFFPDPWCLLYKVHCVPAWPARFWRAPALPPTARVVAFPGSPDPHEAAAGRWPERRWYKRLYKFNRPATWIERAWREGEEAARPAAGAAGPA